jgi:hypothetical protein
VGSLGFFRLAHLDHAQCDDNDFYIFFKKKSVNVGPSGVEGLSITLFILIMRFVLTLRQLVEQFKIAPHKRFLFSTAPSLYLPFSLFGVSYVGEFLGPEIFYRESSGCVPIEVSLLMLSDSLLKVGSTTCVI